MKYYNWELRYECPKCNWHCNDLKNLIIDICPRCGDSKNLNFIPTVMRWVDTSVWWKPWTWNKGYWEKKVNAL